MARGKYQRRGQPSASPSPIDNLSFQGGQPLVAALDANLSFGVFTSPETKVEPVSMDALNEAPAAPVTPEAVIAAAPVEATKPKMVRVKLLRNYRPQEQLDPTDPKKLRRLDPVFEIVGHWKPAVIVRNKLGKEETLSPETFVEDEPAPSPKAGVGYVDKLWAGTIARFTSEEAKYIRANGIGEIEIDD